MFFLFFSSSFLLSYSFLILFYSYTVSTLIQSSSYPQEFSVNRRFKDFEWLHNSLTLHCPGVLIPPLPKKEFFGRFDEDFIQSRIRGLEAFLHRILRHPLLNQQTYVRSFLQDHSMEVSYTNFKSIENQTNKRSESISSWFEAKIDNLKVSQQDVSILFYFLFLSFLSFFFFSFFHLIYNLIRFVLLQLLLQNLKQILIQFVNMLQIQMIKYKELIKQQMNLLNIKMLIVIFLNYVVLR